MKNHDENGILDIDLDRLEAEWAYQPKLFHEWAARLAEVHRDVEYAKAELKVWEAELDRAIRTNPEKYGLDKVTEPAVAKMIALQPVYNDASTKVIDLKYKEDMLSAMVQALDHRKRALENAVDLHGQGYFAAPRAPQHSRNDLQNSKRNAAMKNVSSKVKHRTP